MNREPAEERLPDYLLNGVAKDIFLAEEAEFLAREIDEHADEIKESGFERLFGSLRLMLSDRQTLHVTRLYETANARHPIRSIPTILQFLEEHSDEWSLPHRSSLEGSLADHGAVSENLEILSSAELTRTAVSTFRGSVPHIIRMNVDPLSFSLNSLRFSRDKIIAHNEVIDVSDSLRASWEDAASLTNYAKRFVHVIAYAYLNISFSGLKNDYALTRDANRTALELHRLLRAANIVSSVAPY